MHTGQVLQKQGWPATTLYIIKKGLVDLLDDCGMFVQTLGPGEFFGDEALLSRPPQAPKITEMNTL